ncbi:DUF3781 domain-containing protein [Flavobacterium sp. xlx-214]|uniref:DUF3781 domain-containing protein n=1 Tax=unclassified Flavobacterium TaxID=196869 RepID=UPI0013D7FE21|nr:MULTISPECIES: DUF3781 domain-containing protein [unclassified Flavobacterium]MBA5792640.1 DUF3781 domain-containing protein [Flavobacterium sp. xlx-221]QMI83789.1 DUF3781 domain-containing protein [Flavobacterium sp. xlx-214]
MEVIPEMLSKIGYTPLVYGRINKKLKTSYSNAEIETLIYDIVQHIKEDEVEQIGKNYYLSSSKHKIRITINSYTFRVITVDRLKTS